MILLLGAKELRARMDSLKEVFKPAGAEWAQRTVRLARGRVRVRTGRTRDSIRVRSTTKARAVVAARWGARFIEGDTKAHEIRAKRGRVLRFDAGRTIFAPKVLKRAHAGRPFLSNSATDALNSGVLKDELVEAWNRGA